jgi:hypothetical protein
MSSQICVLVTSLEGKFYGVRTRGWMGPRASLDVLDALAGKQTAIRRLLIPYCNLKIVRNVLSGLQLTKKWKNGNWYVLEESTHRRCTSKRVLYIGCMTSICWRRVKLTAFLNLELLQVTCVNFFVHMFCVWGAWTTSISLFPHNTEPCRSRGATGYAGWTTRL